MPELLPLLCRGPHHPGNDFQHGHATGIGRGLRDHLVVLLGRGGDLGFVQIAALDRETRLAVLNRDLRRLHPWQGVNLGQARRETPGYRRDWGKGTSSTSTAAAAAAATTRHAPLLPQSVPLVQMLALGKLRPATPHGVGVLFALVVHVLERLLLKDEDLPQLAFSVLVPPPHTLRLGLLLEGGQCECCCPWW